MKFIHTEPCHQHGQGARHDAPLSFLDAYCVKRKAYEFATQYALRLTVLAVALPLLLLFFSHSPTAAQAPASERAQAELAIGFALYQERCANCHGPEGMGDGEIAGSLPLPPRDYTDADFQHTAVPFDLFMALTNGIPAGAMPPFGPQSSNPLSETDRWRLVSVIYALGADELTLAVGADSYQTSCAECHGDDGRELPAADLTDPLFWVEQSNAQILAALQVSETAEHEFELGDADGRALLHYMRLSFDEPTAIMAPLPQATISGQVTNGSLNAPFTGGAEARLRAFTAELEVALDMTAPVDADGFYQFNLENEASPGWFYRVTVMHNGLEFNSNFDQISRQNPELDLPVTVFDATSDSGAIRVDQLHIIVDFIPGYMRVGQLYSFSNMATAVYVGPTGSAANGTVTVSLPANAEDIFFERALGGMEQFVPVNEMIAIGNDEYAYTLPLRPGQSSLNLLVQYVVPYESSVTLRHGLAYETMNMNMVLPADNNLRLGSEGNWREMEQAQFGQGAFRSYSGTPRSAGSEFVLSLSGRATVSADGQPMAAARDQTVELLLGGAALLLVIAAVAFFWQRQQQASVTAVAADEYEDEYDDEEEDEDEDFDPADLLQAIADLDASYEAGEISEKLYNRQRQALKEALKAAYR